MRLVRERKDGADDLEVAVETLVIAGWTGRDAAAVEAHIVELEAIGVARPGRVPCFYRVAADLLTSGPAVQVTGTASSGEVEAVLFGTPEGMLVGVGSDHTDREVETYSVIVSKQMCAKPVAPRSWPYREVADHWDALMLRSWAIDGKSRRLYQEGAVANMRTPEDLIGRYAAGAKALGPGTAMFCGTLTVHGGVAAAERFEIEIEDPVLGRRITHAYDVAALPTDG